jgi:hypothetical protein
MQYVKSQSVGGFIRARGMAAACSGTAQPDGLDQEPGAVSAGADEDLDFASLKYGREIAAQEAQFSSRHADAGGLRFTRSQRYLSDSF